VNSWAIWEQSLKRIALNPMVTLTDNQVDLVRKENALVARGFGVVDLSNPDFILVWDASDQ
jgi:hypothetical protein